MTSEYYRDKEQYDFMLNLSPDARKCVENFNSGEFFKHAQNLINLVKIGYSRNEIDSFLRILYKKDIKND